MTNIRYFSQDFIDFFQDLSENNKVEGYAANKYIFDPVNTRELKICHTMNI